MPRILRWDVAHKVTLGHPCCSNGFDPTDPEPFVPLTRVVGAPSHSISGRLSAVPGPDPTLRLPDACSTE